ncbi:hypothetical protein G7Y79_00006g018250 [Physcia stellaris]|nr:hypothetical protein G7Y79_00006g018250 [Physcia stellaris]
MSAADNRVEFLIEAPQAGPDFHDDDDESEWSGFSSSDDNMIQQPILHHVPNRKRLHSLSLDEFGPASKRRRQENSTSDQETAEASDDTAIPPLPPMEFVKTPNSQAQTMPGGLGDENSDDRISKALLDLVELWKPVD